MAKQSTTAEEKLFNNIVLDGDCWSYTVLNPTTGYGRIHQRQPKNEYIQTHVMMYKLLVGDYENGLHLDHLCRNRSCCNPDHLEPVPPKENLRRSPSQITTINANKTHCRNGHEFTEENTYRRKDRPNNRDCRICRLESVKKYNSTKKRG